MARCCLLDESFGCYKAARCRKRIHCCTDNLKGFTEAIKAIFPECLTQICIVYQIRNSLKHVTWGERKDFAQDLKKIYTATSKQAGEATLLEVEEKWGEKYPRHGGLMCSEAGQLTGSA